LQKYKIIRKLENGTMDLALFSKHAENFSLASQNGGPDKFATFMERNR
jgi:hypothetical protein